MRKRALPRIVIFLLLNCVVFILLSAMQFARTGNFSYRIGDMVVNGRYALSYEGLDEGGQPHSRPLDGGVQILFGGLEFRLGSSGADNGFTLIDGAGERQQVLPQHIAFNEYETVVILSGGTQLVFASRNPNGTPGGGSELRISGEFPEGISAIEIPLRPQRSALVRDEDGRLTITYNRDNYQFSRPLFGDTGRLLISAVSPAISYRVVIERAVNNPADFILSNAGTVPLFTAELDRWTTDNFELWSSNMPPQGDEDMIIAWGAEALLRSDPRSMSSIVPAAFSTSANRSWESAVFQFDRRIGVWERSARIIDQEEAEKNSRITALLAAGDMSLFAEPHLIAFLAVRAQHHLIDQFAAFVLELDPYELSLEYVSGILESSVAMSRWRPRNSNPFEALAELACKVAAEALYSTGRQVFVFSENVADSIFNLRLGLAMRAWGELRNENDWAALGRSLILSVLALGDENGMVPASLEIGQGGRFTIPAQTPRISSASLYRQLSDNEHLPRALPTGIDGMWAWTVASAINIDRTDRHIDINVSFPAGETHYVMIRNVQPFPALQLYETGWRRAPDFESYFNASGWNYFESEQTLVVKLRHRTNVERIRILLVAPPPPPPPPPVVSEEPDPPPDVPPAIPPAMPPVITPDQPPAITPDQPPATTPIYPWTLGH